MLQPLIRVPTGVSSAVPSAARILSAKEWLWRLVTGRCSQRSGTLYICSSSLNWRVLSSLKPWLEEMIIYTGSPNHSLPSWRYNVVRLRCPGQAGWPMHFIVQVLLHERETEMQFCCGTIQPSDLTTEWQEDFWPPWSDRVSHTACWFSRQSFAQRALLIENNYRRELSGSPPYGYYQANNFFPHNELGDKTTYWNWT